MFDHPNSEKDMVVSPPARPEISKESIEQTQAQLALLQGMIKSLLVRGRDYGRPLGQKSDSLWDSGAWLIIGAFNCYAGQRRVLNFSDNERSITVMVEVPLISHATGKIMATGIGAASTEEGKYKYRWVSARDAEEMGYTADLLAKLKMREDKRNNSVEYRVPNPEHGELLNTILTMASKRAEADAAKTLPAVASTLREILGIKPEEMAKGAAEGLYTYSQFWGEVRHLGITSADAYTALGVTHLKDWQVANPKATLKDALGVVRAWAIKQGMIEGS